MKVEEKITKRIKELKVIRDRCVSAGTKARYNFVIAELGFLLGDIK